jgi:hypothetical protein
MNRNFSQNSQRLSESAWLLTPDAAAQVAANGMAGDYLSMLARDGGRDERPAAAIRQALADQAKPARLIESNLRLRLDSTGSDIEDAVEFLRSDHARYVR